MSRVTFDRSADKALGFVFSWPIRVYFEDTDAAGIVFYANYLKFFERARTEWLRTMDFDSSSGAEKFGGFFVVKSSNVEYHAPASLDDELASLLAVKKLGRASLVLEQTIMRGDQRLTSAQITLCFVDRTHWRVMPLEPTLAARILAASSMSAT